jgi:hypothetical protein
MIIRDAFYIPPQLRIGMNEPQPIVGRTATDLARDEMWRMQRQAEGDRIWRLIEQASEGNG